MQDILPSYDLEIGKLVEFYRKLNEPILFPDGMVTSLGIVYWGKDEHMASLQAAVPCLQAEGIYRFGALLEAIRTPGRLKKLSQQTGISPAILRILRHDLDLWFPKRVALAEIEPLRKHAAQLDKLRNAGIEDQLQLLSAARSRQSRRSLSKRLAIPPDTLEEIVEYCDLYRMGSNLKHIRTQIYYDMGLDTWQKWAAAASEEVIRRFADHIQTQGLEAVRLVPWPKEVRNGIEWAKYHLSLFAVEW